MKTTVLPIGLTALVRPNGCASYEKLADAERDAEKAREAGLDASVWATSVGPKRYSVVLNELSRASYTASDPPAV